MVSLTEGIFTLFRVSPRVPAQKLYMAELRVWFRDSHSAKLKNKMYFSPTLSILTRVRDESRRGESSASSIWFYYLSERYYWCHHLFLPFPFSFIRGFFQSIRYIYADTSKIGRRKGIGGQLVFTSIWRAVVSFWRIVEQPRTKCHPTKLIPLTAFCSHSKWNDGLHGADVDRYKAEIILINFPLCNNF